MQERSGSPNRIVIGIDDTDMPGTPGTGRMARMLTERLEALGIAPVRGTARYQLYEGPGAPKTSHNSAAALRPDGEGGRFVGLPGIRVLSGQMTEGDILAGSGVVEMREEETGQSFPPGAVLDAGGWIRPRLVGHLPMVAACREAEGGRVHADARSYQA